MLGGIGESGHLGKDRTETEQRMNGTNVRRGHSKDRWSAAAVFVFSCRREGLC